MDYLDSVRAPRPSILQSSFFGGLVSHQEPLRLRKKVKLYSKGAFVEVWSAVHQQWVVDGEVVDIAHATRIEHGLRIAAGSVLVGYASGSKYAWLLPQHVETRLRPSLRPRAPAPMTGHLLQQTYSWSAFRRPRYLDISKGFLCWWNEDECAESGEEALGTVCLLDLQLRREGLDIHLRTSSTQGAVHTFRAMMEGEAAAWERALWVHAGYCQEGRRFTEEQRSGSKVRDEVVVKASEQSTSTKSTQGAGIVSSDSAETDFGRAHAGGA